MKNFERFYNALSEFVDKYGHAHVLRSYISSDGMKLGIAVSNVRNKRLSVNDEEIAKLNEIGFIWRSHEYYFKKWYNYLKAYVDEFGNANVPENYKTPDGYSLGARMAEIRMGRVNLSDEEKKLLSDIGFRFTRLRNKRTSFEDVCKLLHEYYNKYRTYNVKAAYVTNEGIKLGMIIQNMKKRRRMVSDEQKRILKNEFGIIVK